MKNSYSLVINPSYQLKKYLDELILNLSKKYNSPKFEAHMTLVRNIFSDEETVIEMTKEFASKIEPFSLQLGEISFSTTYFQAVFVRVKPTYRLMEANLEAKRIFKLDNDIFMPHISLLYGKQEMKLREKIALELELPENKFFKVESVIVDSDLEDTWTHLAEIPFQN